MLFVGGAAMALAYSTRRATRDVDADFELKGNRLRGGRGGR